VNTIPVKVRAIAAKFQRTQVVDELESTHPNLDDITAAQAQLVLDLSVTSNRTLFSRLRRKRSTTDVLDPA
jgi:hypothetical protein